MNIADNENFTTAAIRCATQYNVSYSDLLKDCVNTPKGNELFHKAGQRTNEDLSPKLTYVPWLTVDEQHSNYIQGGAEFSLLALLCNQFQVRLFYD
jgi:hypothetical protein